METMSRLEKLRLVNSDIEKMTESTEDVIHAIWWHLRDISETLAMIYDKMCEKAEGE